MAYYQLKLFANGVKALYKPKAKAPALLKIFDKDGCLIAQREIHQSGRAVEKMTLRANKTGEMFKEYRLLGFDENGQKIICPTRKAECYDMFVSNPNDKGYYLLENEFSTYRAQQEGLRGNLNSDNILQKMRRQWFNRSERRIPPKPIKDQLKLLTKTLKMND